ncbi:MarR family winged helix-turn-helix transcriptional regulator [Streptomyces sp. NPDC005227]|uniref:MarR family winged helix-turn-helix transcriptional regulator n=1 Tax=unclassified Streptomyces TaxID=2593676 RepID=UPI0036BE821D
MTNPGDLADHQATGPGDDSEVIARVIVDGVERIADTWAAAPHDGPRLTVSQLRALRALEMSPAVNLTAFAERLDIALPAASRLCNRLESAGLLARTSHPLSRREVELDLTAAGRRVMQEISAQRVHALAAVVAEMKPAERDALRCGLAAFQQAARSEELRRWYGHFDTER